MAEIWKEVVGFNKYEVSSRGRVKRRARKASGKYGRNLTEMMLSLFPQSGGYQSVNLVLDGDRVSRLMLVHRLVAETFIGPISDGLIVCHNDGDRSNNRVSNLRIDTQKSNIGDKRRHGTQTCGESHPMVKRSGAVIRDILASAGRESSRQTGKRLGLDDSYVRQVRRGQIWKHLNAGDNQ